MSIAKVATVNVGRKHWNGKMKFKVGDQHRCPECISKRGKIIWISKSGKTIAVQCPNASSHTHKKDAVILIDVDE